MICDGSLEGRISKFTDVFLISMIHKQPGHLRISQAKEVDSSVLLVVFFLKSEGTT